MNNTTWIDTMVNTATESSEDAVLNEDANICDYETWVKNVNTIMRSKNNLSIDIYKREKAEFDKNPGHLVETYDKTTNQLVKTPFNKVQFQVTSEILDYSVNELKNVAGFMTGPVALKGGQILVATTRIVSSPDLDLSQFNGMYVYTIEKRTFSDNTINYGIRVADLNR